MIEPNPHPLTLQRLAEQAEEFKKQFPPQPPYYRVNQRTYDAVKAMCVRKVPRHPWAIDFNLIELRVDDTVPDGQALPPLDRYGSKIIDDLAKAEMDKGLYSKDGD